MQKVQPIESYMENSKFALHLHAGFYFLHQVGAFISEARYRKNRKITKKTAGFPFFSYICTLYCKIGIKAFLGRKTN